MTVTAAAPTTTPAEPDLILRIEHVTKRFGGLVAVDDVSFDVKRGEVFALIGPNGAGKTTLFNSITGIFPPSEGRVVFEGDDIAGAKPHQAAKVGIARTFQNIRLFEYMSALDNVRVGQHCRSHSKLWDSLFKTPYERREERAITERARELLSFVGIGEHAENYARNLAYGQQRRLEIARALATQPHLLLLDEPAAGFTPQEKVELMRLVDKILGEGITVFLIEHDMKVVMGISRNIAVLDHGELIALGPPEQIRKDQRVIEAYLGKSA
ncbi:MAG TPA: ABC transporter ATP-binding protein [Candidatus Limnocylindria bacterium]